MSTRIAAATVLLVLAIGCEQKRPLAPGTFAMQLAANRHDHAEIVAVATKSSTRNILDRQAKSIVAEWLPVAADSRADEQLTKAEDVITRETPSGLEVLVVRSDFDLTEELVKGAISSGEKSVDGHYFFTVTTFAAGATRIQRMTTVNAPDKSKDIYRRIAMVIGGRLYWLPRIEAELPPTTQFIISTTSAEQSRILADVLNGTARLPSN